MSGYTVRKEFLQAFLRKAERMGFTAAEPSRESSLLELHLNGEFAFCVMPDDEYLYRRDKSEPDKVLDLISVFSETRRAYRTFESARSLPYQSVSNFRLLSEYGNHLMAARLELDGCSLHYVTWEKDYDGKGVSAGHYFGGDYAGAKRDFAIRSGLIDKNELFTEDELVTLHSACSFRGQNDFEISLKDEKKLWDVLDKIGQNIPCFRFGSNER